MEPSVPSLWDLEPHLRPKASLFLFRLAALDWMKLELPRGLHRLACLVRDCLGYEDVALYLREGEATLLRAALGLREDRLGEAVPLEAWGFREAEPQARQEPGGGHLLLVPLAAVREIVGVLALDSPRPFGPEDLALMRPVAFHLAVFLEVARLYDEIKETSCRDGLTDIYNYRHFYEALEAETARSHRQGLSFSLAFLDLHDLKKTNDSYGHLMGDQVLVRTASLLRENLRASDVAARYGGDEFAVILPQTSKVEAEKAMLRLKGAMAKAVAAVGSITIPLPDISWGLASYPEDGLTSRELVATADRGLYRSRGQELRG